MAGYTEEQVEEMVQEAVAKTERSFGGTFKRLKSENEEFKAAHEKTLAEQDTVRSALEKRLEELESIISDNKSHISELAKRGELQRQLREKGPIPERFLDVSAIEYSDDPETLVRNVADVIDRGRKEFEQVLGEYGISFQHAPSGAGNPTNPPSRDTTTAHSLKSAEARDALHDMVRRGLIR